MADPTPDKHSRTRWAAAGMGIEFGAGVAGMTLLGYGFDRWQDTAPWGLLIGGCVGIIVGMFTMIRLALKMKP